MKIENLVIGEPYKNWKALCEALEVEPKSGSYKQKQERDFKQYFDWEKQGQKIIITEIYNEVQERKDGLRENTFTERYVQPKKTHEVRHKGNYFEMDVKQGDKIFTVLFDNEDYEQVMDYRWSITRNGYVRSTVGHMLLHRLVTDLGIKHEEYSNKRLVVHHKNHNPLDNRKENLQIMTEKEHIELHKKERAYD